MHASTAAVFKNTHPGTEYTFRVQPVCVRPPMLPGGKARMAKGEWSAVSAPFKTLTKDEVR